MFGGMAEKKHENTDFLEFSVLFFFLYVENSIFSFEGQRKREETLYSLMGFLMRTFSRRGKSSYRAAAGDLRVCSSGQGPPHLVHYLG